MLVIIRFSMFFVWDVGIEINYIKVGGGLWWEFDVIIGEVVGY